jgi:leader peptidase (prepilin peptidase)/N-methyltransferase
LGFLDISAQHAVWGAVAGYGSLWLVATLFEQLTGKEGMGAGDFKLLAALGAWLGPFALIPLVLMASVGGALVGIWLQSTHRLERGGYVPFGPFLAVAGAVQAFYGGADVFFT